MNDAFFRAGVGACVLDAEGRVLAMRRKSPPDAWQMPQGGIEFGETPLDALHRELEEEAGLRARDVAVVAELPDWHVYEVPRAYRNAKIGWGQAQRWFICRVAARATVRPDDVEFTDLQWLSPSDLLDRAVDFRRPVYSRVFAALATVTALP